jgi:Carboxypeptidase regulatory-like domain/TonB dependent receptor
VAALGSARPATSQLRRLLLAGVALLLAGSRLEGQGVTAAAVEGQVLARDGSPIAKAIVQVSNGATGERWGTATDPRGRYFIEYLPVGGPYRVAVAAIGYRPVERDSMFVSLGQRLAVQFTLTPAEVQLEEIVVTAADSGLSAGARTGPSRIVSRGTVARLPVKGRDYTSLAVLSPQVTASPNGGLSFAGQHDRLNSVQIDGTSNTDPFGRARTGNGPPGNAVGLTAFTPEAVQELQIVTAPFDIRYGGFAGGLINAVTRSGSNRVEASIRGQLESSGLTGLDSAGNRASDFTNRQLELTLGTPIVRDRVALFLNAASTREVSPQTVPAPVLGDTATGVLRYETAARFRDLLRTYGAEAGSFAAGSYSTPSWNLFLKVTAQLGLNSHLAVSHNHGHGNDRQEIGARDPSFYGFSSSGTLNPETINATRLEWTAALGARLSNQLLAARVDDRRTCVPSSDFAAVSLVADDIELHAGGPASCSGLETGHTLWQLTDNVGLVAGGHRLTFGVRGERGDLVDDVLDFPGGLWTFDGLDSLAQGMPAEYQRDSSAGSDSRVAFRVNQVSVYGQDEWAATPRLTLTAGLRLDVPYVPTPPARRALAASELGINTSLTPSGNLLWSPRLGVNYDLTGRGTTVLRGGVGYFAGPPPYVWFRNVYGTAGIRSHHLDCLGDEVPAFTLDPAHQPTACSTSTPTAGLLAFFDPGFRFPQSLKLALGLDRRLPGGIVGTVDLLYTRLVNSVTALDVNLAGPVGISAGEGGRTLYGSIDETTGRATPERVSTALRGVFPLRNGGGDRSYSLTAQLDKHFPGGTEISAAYTYTEAKDRMSLVADLGGVNNGSTPVDGTLEHRALRTSIWERPHKITVVGTADLPYGFQLGVTWIGMSGPPYTYVAQGDPNADGFRPDFGVSNDVVYVPRDAADITLADPAEFAPLDSVIRSERCLRRQRGRLIERDSCRDPWENETTVRFSKLVRLADRRTVEMSVDLFNLLNFVDDDWGLVRQTIGEVGNAVPLLQLVGYDTPNSRGIYTFVPVARRQIDVDASRWRLQLGATVSY